MGFQKGHKAYIKFGNFDWRFKKGEHANTDTEFKKGSYPIIPFPKGHGKMRKDYTISSKIILILTGTKMLSFS